MKQNLYIYIYIYTLVFAQEHCLKESTFLFLALVFLATNQLMGGHLLTKFFFPTTISSLLFLKPIIYGKRGISASTEQHQLGLLGRHCIAGSKASPRT
jgi:hypothetical protein